MNQHDFAKANLKTTTS